MYTSTITSCISTTLRSYPVGRKPFAIHLLIAERFAEQGNSAAETIDTSAGVIC
jgi:hypothetical protein